MKVLSITTQTNDLLVHLRGKGLGRRASNVLGFHDLQGGTV